MEVNILSQADEVDLKPTSQPEKSQDQPSSETSVVQSRIAELLAILPPEKRLADIISSHQQQPHEETLNQVQQACLTMSQWLDAANLVLYALEQNISGDLETTALRPLDEAVESMQNCVSYLQDILEKIDEMIVLEQEENVDLRQKVNVVKLSITKLQSEWSAFKHYFTSVNKQFRGLRERKQLLETMNDILVQIDELSTVIFEFQERRHAAAAAATRDPKGNSESNDKAELSQNDKNRDDLTLMHIDSRVEPLFAKVDSIYTQLVSPSPPYDPEGILVKKHLVVQQQWENLRIEIDELKDELKEDRWLSVFRQVANQVDVMIDGLDRVVSHCQQVVSMFRDWKSSEIATKQTSTSGNHPPSAFGSFERLTKSLLRAYPKSHHSSTSASSVASNSSNTSSSSMHQSVPPLDREKFRSLAKGFEAKYKYYTPAIDRMIGMLGTGISQRVTHDTQAKSRHNAIKERWENLRSVMDDLRANQLPEIERTLSDRPQSPAWSGTSEDSHTTDRSERSHSHWKGISQNKPGWNASTKEDSKQYIYEPLWKSEYRPLGDLDDKEDEELMRRGRTKSPSRLGGRPDENDENGASWMKPTKSTIMRRRAQSMDRALSRQAENRPKTPTSRPKTPNPPNNRSHTPTKTTQPPSRQFLSPYTFHEPIPYPDRDRAVSPSSRRSETPSLIPRPKTPTSSRPTSPMASELVRPSSRPKTPLSPSLIPRARSALGHNSPPVPPLPKSVQSEEWLPVQSYGSLLNITSPSIPQLSKKTSTPVLNQRSAYHHRDYTPNTNEMQINIDEIPHYVADPKDPLDVEVGKILNASPIAIKCQRSPQGGGRYYFGNDLSPSLGGGKKMYLCRLMNYAEKSNIDPSLLSSRTRTKPTASRNKVLVRVGGGWQDLEIFLLEHASLMVSDVVVRSFTS
ncbi:hypothetical protein INT44_009084 [Umbelopsis vinacea]|uniref:GAR domain-containing protein n=1 Tax=Umbelopsis vinacea TaxID=44442 RepID=A0A8H7Q2Z0_9FUNG|nr:hypothetical protein INT44_009084 [Umbelopsis vinacea]